MVSNQTTSAAEQEVQNVSFSSQRQILLRMALSDYCFSPWIQSAANSLRPRPWNVGASLGRRLTNWFIAHSREGDEQVRLGDGSWLTIPAGGTYVVEPGALATIRSLTGNRTIWLHVDLVFHPRRAETPWLPVFGPELGARAAWLQPDGVALFGFPLPTRAPATIAHRLASELPVLVERFRLGGPAGSLDAALAVGRLLLAWAAAARPLAGNTDEQRLALAEHHAQANLSRNIGIVAMASAAGLSRTRFCARYRELRGETPGVFLRRARLARAAELLRTSDLSVRDIAPLVGYPDGATLSRAFTQSYGHSPGRWRRS